MPRSYSRREFLTLAGGTAAALAIDPTSLHAGPPPPNVLIIMCDQLRAQALPIYGNPDCATPNIDRLAAQGAVFDTAMCPCPTCVPTRASFQTGLHPVTIGKVTSGKELLDPAHTCLPEVLGNASYRTGYIGKWHLYGGGYAKGSPEREGWVPPEARQGWQWWRANNCRHRYWDDHYFADEPIPIPFQGYEPYVQTGLALEFMDATTSPWALMVSFGPPHRPYDNPPPEFDKYSPNSLWLPPNVPEECAEQARVDLSGYYAHLSALDWCVGKLLESVPSRTLILFTSDHGDMLGSHGRQRKRLPFDAAARVPLLVAGPGIPPGMHQAVVNTPDLMPSILRLCGVESPPTDGVDLFARGGPDAYLNCDARTEPTIGRWWEAVRTDRYLYARDYLTYQPWLLYDYAEDPWEETNLVGDLWLRRRLERRLLALRPGSHIRTRTPHASK